MYEKNCLAMILAGGQGSRLGVLTKTLAKPGVPFGGKYRIIDFTLSNCVHSGIDTVGVLTQYRPLELNTYIGNGRPWDLDRNNGGIFILPPYLKTGTGEWYKGTANAIYQNIGFVEQYNPKHVLVLSGDHIYKMHYGKMMDMHVESGAAVTIGVLRVPICEASRFGIMHTDRDGRIISFEEKPAKPTSDLASMGIYLFDRQILKKYLIMDENNPKSDNDFGKNVIPHMLAAGEKLVAYKFDGYWKDVGTLKSFWDANMDLLQSPPRFDLYDPDWKIFCRNTAQPPHFAATGARIANSILTEGCAVYGRVEDSVLFRGALVDKNAHIRSSIIFPDAHIESDAIVENAIIGSGAVIRRGAYIGSSSGDTCCKNDICAGGISVVGDGVLVEQGVTLCPGSMVDKNISAPQEIGLQPQETYKNII